MTSTAPWFELIWNIVVSLPKIINSGLFWLPWVSNNNLRIIYSSFFIEYDWIFVLLKVSRREIENLSGTERTFPFCMTFDIVSLFSMTSLANWFVNLHAFPGYSTLWVSTDISYKTYSSSKSNSPKLNQHIIP